MAQSGFKAIPGIPDYEYDEKQEYGRGSTSVVYKARHVSHRNKELAVKVMTTPIKDLRKLQEVKAAWKKELETAKEMGEFWHGLPVHKTSIEKKSAFIVMDAGTRSLKQFNDLLDDRPSEKEIVTLALQLLTFVDVSLMQGILQNDLHPGNVLLTDVSPDRPETDLFRYTVTVVDYGNAVRINLETREADPGTKMQFRYAAPERFRRTDEKDDVTVGEKSEVWSVAAILLELLTGLPPTGRMDETMARMTYERKERRPLAIPGRYCSELIELMDEMLELDPDKRKTLSAAVNALEAIEAKALFYPAIVQGLELGGDDDDTSSGGSGNTQPQKRKRDDGEQSSGSGGDQDGKRHYVFDCFDCSEVVDRLPETDSGSSAGTTAGADVSAGDAGMTCSGESAPNWGQEGMSGDLIVMQEGGEVMGIPAGRISKAVAAVTSEGTGIDTPAASPDKATAETGESFDSDGKSDEDQGNGAKNEKNRAGRKCEYYICPVCGLRPGHRKKGNLWKHIKTTHQSDLQPVIVSYETFYATESYSSKLKPKN